MNKVVDMYDLVEPTGILEIEMDRDGTIRVIEADVPVSALPASIRAAAEARAPGAEITGAERERHTSGLGWEVKMRWEGRDWEFVFDDDGGLIETEQEIDRGEAPPSAVENAVAVVPAGATLARLERIERGSWVEYHIKFDHHGASYKVIVDAEAKVLKCVREQRAEIEIPLKLPRN